MAGLSRIAYLSYSTGEYDARTYRMARSAIEAGYSVRVYSRWVRGLPAIEPREGYELIRVPVDWRFLVPGLRSLARRRMEARFAAARRSLERAHAEGGTAAAEPRPRPTPRPSRLSRVLRTVLGPVWPTVETVLNFPIRPLGWAAALELVAEPADVWHGMWAGSLPALARLRRRHGGRTVYDSRDVFMESREWAALRWPVRPILRWAERHWARAADRVITVNASYAEILSRLLGISLPPVVMNAPDRWDPQTPAPDLIRAALGLPATTRIVLYQGRLMSDRGIEQAMDAILDVPDAALVLLGFGTWEEELRARSVAPPYAGKVFVLAAVPPDELLAWSASADVLVMAIQATSLNHRYTTPQKLFEAIAAGVPVVASDLPGMAEIVRAVGAGALVDPASPASIAGGIHEVLGGSVDEREARRERLRVAAGDRYGWQRQVDTLLAVYRGLLGDGAPAGSPTIRFTPNAGPPVTEPTGGQSAETVVVLDTTWIAPTSTPNADGGVASGLAARDVVDAVMSDRDIGAEAMARVDAWAEASSIVSRTALHGTSFWYGMRLRTWTWLTESLIWLAVIDRLLEERPGTRALACDPGTDPTLIEACRLVARRDGLAFDAPSPGPARIVGARRGLRGLLARVRARVRRELDERRLAARRASVDRAIARLAAEPAGRLLVIEAHAPQRIEAPAGPRLMNAYLGPIVDALAESRLAPIELDIRADLLRDAEWAAFDPATARRLPWSPLQAAPGAGIPADRDEARRLADAIATDLTPLEANGVDLAVGLRAILAPRVAGTFPRRLREIRAIRDLLRQLRPAAILLADEYHRQEWLAAARLEGVPLAAVQHGVIHRWHLGYIHASRPPELQLPDRTYVFGGWERDLLTSASVYRDDEVVVGGSPRLDLVEEAPIDRARVRRELGVADVDRLVVISGTWGEFHRRFYYPIALRHLFDRPLPRVHVVVKLHPSETNEGPYRAVIHGVAEAGRFQAPATSTVQVVDLYRVLAAADAHLGIRSTVLTEAVVTGTPNLLATGLAGADPLDYVAAGVATPVRDGHDLAVALDAIEDGTGSRPTAEQRRRFIDAHFDPGGGARRIAADLLAWLPADG